MPRITLQLSQEDGIGTLHFNGEEYECGGNSSFDYPEDSTISGYKEYCHYSRENDFVMHYAVLWDGTYGTYFHEVIVYMVLLVAFIYWKETQKVFMMILMVRQE